MQMSTGSRSRRRRLPLTLTAFTTVAASTVLGLAGPASAAGSVSYPHSVPTWATPADDTGPAAADTTVEGELYLDMKDLPGATAYAKAVSTPGSPLYRHWLTPQRWIDAYAPTQQTFDTQLQRLQDQGLTIVGTPASRLFIVFRGTADQVAAAFDTQLHTYRVAGHQLVAPAKAPQLPASVAAGVTGMELDQGRLLTRPHSVTPAETTTAPTGKKSPSVPTVPCSAYYGQHTAQLPQAYGRTNVPSFLCGYTAPQLRSAYGVTGTGLDGSGQRVAIIDAYASKTIVSDVDTFAAAHGEPALTNYTEDVSRPFYDEALCQYPSGWQGEETLDVTAVHDIAPAAAIHYVGAFNCGGGIDVALSSILDTRSDTIVSNSYGDEGELLPADAIQGQENQHLQAAAEGIGLYYSSGDSGDESPNGLAPQPDYEASSPWVTAVGGTSTGIDGNGNVVAEAGWGSNVDKVVVQGSKLAYGSPLPGAFAGGAGGGRSTVFAEPDYQQGIVPASLAAGHRVSPDIAADADPYTGMRMGITPSTHDGTAPAGPYTEETYGGTSLASPLVAAQMALVQQLTHVTVGFANPALYALHRAVPSVPRDVSSTDPFLLGYTSKYSGNTYLVVGNRDTSLAVTPGYDDVTGLGAITFDALRRATTGR